MAIKHVVDAHAIIWFLEGHPALGRAAKSALGDPASDLVLPVIALAEAVFVVNRGRTSLPDSDALLRDVAADSRIEIAPLTADILIASPSVSAVVSELHDRLIVAHALVLQQKGHQVALVTKDQSIVQSGVVPIAWK